MELPKIIKLLIDDSKHFPKSWQTQQILLGLLHAHADKPIAITDQFLTLGFGFTLEGSAISSLIVNKTYAEFVLHWGKIIRRIDTEFECEEIEV